VIKIGVSACFLYPNPDRDFFSKKTLCYLENDMANYLYRDDVLPILIPNLKENALDIFLSQMDGFVFQGGSDLCPQSYGEDFLNKEKWSGDIFRDRYELKIADYAFKHAKPILGICRGAQLMNVYFGGTLYQDLPTQHTNSSKHRDAIEYDGIFHSIEFTSGILAKLYRNEINPHVNSVHHQGIKTLGKNLVIEAISPQDNLIEAFSYHNMQDNFVLAVQWHPEFSHTIKDKLISADPIYDYFINTVREKMRA
jgi:putative glutamine amidotransferase